MKKKYPRISMKAVPLFFFLGISLSQCNLFENPPNFDNPFAIDIILSEGDSLKIDLNLDKEIDVIFRAIYETGSGAYAKVLEVEVLNNFEVAIQNGGYYEGSDFNRYKIWTVDTIMIEIPKIFSLNDTINNECIYLTGSIDIASYTFAYWSGYEFEYYSADWLGSGIRYIGLKNEEEDIFCWVKVSAEDYNTLNLISYKLNIDSEYLTIDE